ncbi:hypothetical protein HZA76_02395 [Candidatus Roizmanbacteria bacterium]|nr:hypothetical protein [Candidatus Roizmanbacteria bacterium]
MGKELFVALAKRESFSSSRSETITAPLRKETRVGRFLDRVNQLSIDRYFHNRNPEFLEYRREIEAGLTQDKIKRVLFDQDMKGTKPGTANFDRLIAVSSLREQIKRQMIREVLQKGENRLRLSEPEKIVLLANCDLADQMDLFYRRWSQNEAKNPLSKKLKKMSPKERTKFLEKKGVRTPETNYLYLDLIENPPGSGKIEKVPYSVGYGEQVGKIVKTINQMCVDLGKVKTGKKSAKNLATYYRSYAKALASTNLDKQEKLWKKVDENWLAVRGRMQPIHMMESYVDPAGLRVDPDLSLMFLDDRYQKLTNRAKNTQVKMVDWLIEELGDKKSALKSEKSMRMALVGMYNPSVIAGRRHTFRPAGQNIPNREDVRLQGVKIFLDVETMKQRWQEEKKLLSKIFGSKRAEKLFNEGKMIDIGMSVLVAGHEVAHNLFIVRGTRKAMGESAYNNLEEHKSSHAITAAAGEILSPEDQKQLLLYLFASSLRSFSLKGDESRKPYYYDAVVCMNLMNFAGIVRNNNGKIEFNFSEPNMRIFFGQARQLLTGPLAETYDKKDPKMAEAYIKTYFKESKLVNDLVKRVSKQK